MTPVEIIALIIVLLGVVKLVVLLTKPQAWMHGTKKLWHNSNIFTAVALVLMLVALRYLLEELTIVQIFAVFGFMMPLFWIGLAPFREEIFALAEKRVMGGNILKKNWLMSVIWLVLVVWVLKEIF